MADLMGLEINKSKTNVIVFDAEQPLCMVEPRGNSAATHVATVILTREISSTAYIFKALHWIKGAVTPCNATACQV